MSRPLRFAAPWQTVELSARTFQGRFLLQPSPRLNALIAGILALAKEKYAIRLYSFIFLSNHFHMQAAAASPPILSAFMCFVMGNIAREIGRLHGWSGHFWDRRYRMIPITDDASIIDRLRYILEHGCKEGLVSHPSLWPGLHCVQALTRGTPIKGIWVDRSSMYQAKKRIHLKVQEADFSTNMELELDILPVWEELPIEERQARAHALVEHAALSAPTPLKGKEMLRRSSFRKRSPHYRPKRLKRRPAPMCHGSTRAARRSFHEAYEVFVNTYRMAAETLRENLSALGFPSHAQVMAFCVPDG